MLVKRKKKVLTSRLALSVAVLRSAVTESRSDKNLSTVENSLSR